MGDLETALLRSYSETRRRLQNRAKPSPPQVTVTTVVKYICTSCLQESEDQQCAAVNERRPTMQRIIALVSETEGVSMQDMMSIRKFSGGVRARHIAMYLGRSLTTLSLPQISRRIGRKDHTTILHGIRKITALRSMDKSLDERLAWYERVLGEKNG